MTITTYPQMTGSSNVGSSMTGVTSTGGTIGTGFFGGFGAKGLALVATSISGMNAAAAAIVAAGGGELHLIPNGSYVATPADANSRDATSTGYANMGMVGIDTAYINFFGNRATVDIRALGNNKIGFHLYSSVALHSATYNQMNRTFEDVLIVGGDYNSQPYLNSTGVTAMLFHSDPGATGDPTYGVKQTSVRVQVERVHIHSCLKAQSFKSVSYCVRTRDSHIIRNRFGLFNENNPIDYAEKNVWEDVVFAENYCHLYDNGTPINPQVWSFTNCQFDYYYGGYNIYLNGAKAYFTSCHTEWNYGANGGETNYPFYLTGANAGIWWRGGTMVYSGAGQNPNWVAPFRMDNGAQYIDVTLDKCAGLGRLSNTSSYNSWVDAIGGTNGKVAIRVDPEGATLTAVPSMTVMSDSGQGGQLAHGITSIYTNELINHIVASGTAVVAQVAANENGVTRKATQPMMKITGQGKVLINFPNTSPGRRHAWQFFTATSTATSIFAGSVTIKARREGCAIRLDGTASANSTTGVSLVTDNRAASYSPNTTTISSANATWVRRSWADHDTTFPPAPRLSNSLVIPVEIDTTNMTAGAIYISHAGYDII